VVESISSIAIGLDGFVLGIVGFVVLAIVGAQLALPRPDPTRPVPHPAADERVLSDGTQLRPNETALLAFAGFAVILILVPSIGGLVFDPARFGIGLSLGLGVAAMRAVGGAISGAAPLLRTGLLLTSIVLTALVGTAAAAATVVAVLGASSDGPSKENSAPAASLPQVISKGLLRVSLSGSGSVTSEPSGIRCAEACTAEFPLGTKVVLTPLAGSGSMFVEWTGACEGADRCAVSVGGSSEVKAIFARLMTLQINVDGGGMVTSDRGIVCNATCSLSLPENAAVTLTASPGPTTIFAGWGGACSGTTTCSVTLAKSSAVNASFALPILTVTRIGDGTGTVASNPSGLNCGSCTLAVPRDSRVTLLATPAFGSAFGGWTGACGGTGSCSLAVTGNLTVGARFTQLVAKGFAASSMCNTSALTLRPGEAGTFTACFANTGGTTWTLGSATQVDLAQCCPPNTPSPNASWAVSWLSLTAYTAQGQSAVVPRATGTFTFQVRVPKNASSGTYVFEGYLVLHRTGEIIAGTVFKQTVVVPVG